MTEFRHTYIIRRHNSCLDTRHEQLNRHRNGMISIVTIQRLVLDGRLTRQMEAPVPAPAPSQSSRFRFRVMDMEDEDDLRDDGDRVVRDQGLWSMPLTHTYINMYPTRTGRLLFSPPALHLRPCEAPLVVMTTERASWRRDGVG
ncbi:hypothetical protein L249_6622 [Ophiocordyceps polyrhachis-furcata BCC 54312]|uniref:Uncharacterized protein n=1 Tax=Ophiocordyceps polyrhachis-furcata BCC 54312 TaxID=1330021 RepID=A0A367LJJ5_9HYPO|nr:hypothetical protein L249_6622 [Ophiocordyceps polyrhachis-furcata BCC 54312]